MEVEEGGETSGKGGEEEGGQGVGKGDGRRRLHERDRNLMKLPSKVDERD